jgi:hypothetical protein
MKLNKLLTTRIFVSVHAWEGGVVKMKSNRCQLTYDILLLRRHANHLMRCQDRYVWPLLSMTIEHPLIQENLIVYSMIIPHLFKMNKYILTDANYLTITDDEAIQSLKCNVITRFGVPNSLLFLISYFYLTVCLLQIIQSIVIKLHE